RHTLGGRAARRSGRREGGRGLPRRVVPGSSAAAATMIALAAGSVLASGNSLPGDTLYPVKRVAESAGLALTFDEEGRARRHLEIAATRLSEVEQLAREAETPPAPEVFTSAMDDFDSATNEGSQLLLSAAQAEEERTAAEDLRKWASEQSDRLAELEPALPESADADTSRELLERLLGQTQRLEADEKCEQGDCASRRTSGESTAESEPGEDSDEDTTTTPDGDSSKSSETDRPSRTPDSSTDRENPRLLPDLVPDANKDDEKSSKSAEKDEDSESSSEKDSDDEKGGGNVSVPLPLLPPVTLPPLLPGMPGITIG
ncbi:DUF5667 domain-containing protein, partial [Pseudonocardia zijingensis]|uniref:DUF5667 domain-containing protein n=1 Tax=Pseudonocardia zijingensis TaxID=153376 RepID=UPI0031D0BDB9